MIKNVRGSVSYETIHTITVNYVTYMGHNYQCLQHWTKCNMYRYGAFGLVSEKCNASV